MIDRLTQCARDSLAVAQKEAFIHDSGTIEPQHLVLGALSFRDDGATLLVAELAGDANTVYRALHDALPEAAHDPDAVMTSPVPFSAAAKRAVGLSLRESLRAGHATIGSVDQLLGVLALKRGPAVTTLAAMGVTLRAARRIASTSAFADLP